MPMTSPNRPGQATGNFPISWCARPSRHVLFIKYVPSSFIKLKHNIYLNWEILLKYFYIRTINHLTSDERKTMYCCIEVIVKIYIYALFMLKVHSYFYFIVLVNVYLL